MNRGVEILIERMKTNPEDFLQSGRFGDTARRIKEELTGVARERQPWFTRQLLTETEWEALTTAYKEMAREMFTQTVMKNLLKDTEEQKYGAIAQPVMTMSANGNLGVGTTSATSFTVGTQAKNAVTIAPYHNGPSIDFNKENINTLNEMIEAWRGEKDGTF